MNRFFNLPVELQNSIYEFDPTAKEKYDLCVQHINEIDKIRREKIERATAYPRYNEYLDIFTWFENEKSFYRCFFKKQSGWVFFNLTTFPLIKKKIEMSINL